MRTRILSLAVIAIMVGTIVTSCGEASKKDMKAAKEDMSEAGKDLNQAGKDAQEEIQAAVKADWGRFKANSEAGIADIASDIKTLREKISKASKNEQEKLAADLDRLEEKNKELQAKLEQRGRDFKQNVIEFNDSAKENEKQFEREFTHDMDELGTALKDLFKDNVE